MEEHIWPESALEMTELIKGTAAWKQAVALVHEARATGQSTDWLAERVVVALKDEWNLDEMIGSTESLGLSLSDSDRAALHKLYGYHMAAAVVADIEGIPRPLLPMMAGGVQVLTHKDKEFELPMVYAIASPLTSGTVCTDFERQCDETFAQTIGNHPEAVRDAGWFRRHQAGERWTEIALSDKRSGITPQAVVNPSEYPEDVRKAADLVRHAARRYKERWTEVLDSLSANPD